MKIHNPGWLSNNLFFSWDIEDYKQLPSHFVFTKNTVHNTRNSPFITSKWRRIFFTLADKIDTIWKLKHWKYIIRAFFWTFSFFSWDIGDYKQLPSHFVFRKYSECTKWSEMISRPNISWKWRRFFFNLTDEIYTKWKLKHWKYIIRAFFWTFSFFSWDINDSKHFPGHFLVIWRALYACRAWLHIKATRVFLNKYFAMFHTNSTLII